MVILTFHKEYPYPYNEHMNPYYGVHDHSLQFLDPSTYELCDLSIHHPSPNHQDQASQDLLRRATFVVIFVFVVFCIENGLNISRWISTNVSWDIPNSCLVKSWSWEQKTQKQPNIQFEYMILWRSWDMGAPFYDIQICLSVSSQTNPFWIRQQNLEKKTSCCFVKSQLWTQSEKATYQQHMSWVRETLLLVHGFNPSEKY